MVKITAIIKRFHWKLSEYIITEQKILFLRT